MSGFRHPERLRREQYADATNLRARAALHERFGTHPQPWLEWVFERVAPAAGARVLEVGAGPGALWAANRARTPALARLVLGDLSAGMVAEARRAVVGAQACVLDARRIPFADASFDVAVANHMLYHVPQLGRALDELHRVLAPGGRLAATTNGARHLREIDLLVREAGGRDDTWPVPPVEAFSLENGARSLATRFEAVHLERYPDHLEVTEVEPLLAYVRSLAAAGPEGPSLGGLAERIAREIAQRGCLRIGKDAGIFSARRR